MKYGWNVLFTINFHMKYCKMLNLTVCTDIFSKTNWNERTVIQNISILAFVPHYHMTFSNYWCDRLAHHSRLPQAQDSGRLVLAGQGLWQCWGKNLSARENWQPKYFSLSPLTSHAAIENMFTIYIISCGCRKTVRQREAMSLQFLAVRK